MQYCCEARRCHPIHLKIAAVLSVAAERAGIPKGAIQLVEDTSRETVNAMLKLNEYLDVLIPRGGAGLIQNVVKNATVPVIETGCGELSYLCGRNC